MYLKFIMFLLKRTKWIKKIFPIKHVDMIIDFLLAMRNDVKIRNKERMFMEHFLHSAEIRLYLMTHFSSKHSNPEIIMVSYLVANPPVPPLVLVFFLFMMRDIAQIDPKPQGLARHQQKESKNHWFVLRNWTCLKMRY